MKSKIKSQLLLCAVVLLSTMSAGCKPAQVADEKSIAACIVANFPLLEATSDLPGAVAYVEGKCLGAEAQFIEDLFSSYSAAKGHPLPAGAFKPTR